MQAGRSLRSRWKAAGEVLAAVQVYDGVEGGRALNRFSQGRRPLLSVLISAALLRTLSCTFSQHVEMYYSIIIIMLNIIYI